MSIASKTLYHGGGVLLVSDRHFESALVESMHLFLKCFLWFASRWTNWNESVRSGLAVLDVTIPTGYIVQQQDLDAYIRSRQVRNLQRARFQERKVLFYFDFVSISHRLFEAM